MHCHPDSTLFARFGGASDYWESPDMKVTSFWCLWF